MNFCGCFKLVNKNWRVELYVSMDVNPQSVIKNKGLNRIVENENENGIYNLIQLGP